MVDEATLLAATRGSVVAPAGCGKTEPIARAVRAPDGGGTLILTHKRHLTRMRKDGLISWTARTSKDGGEAANAYDLSGLIKHVGEFAVAELAARETEADARKARGRGKRPMLRALAGEKGPDDE